MTPGGSVQPFQHIHQLRLLVNQCQSAGIFSSFEVHQFSSFNSLRLRPLALHSIFCFFGFQVGQVVLPGRRGCQQQMLITGINVLQATNRSDMVTDNTFGYKCVFSKIIQFYLKKKIHALCLLGRATEGEAFSRMTDGLCKTFS